MQERTCAEAVAQFFESPTTDYVDSNRNERIWGHDFLHALLNAPSNRTRNEEIVAIYQAVLLRDPEVRKRKKWFDAGQGVGLTEIHAQVIPGARRFIAELPGLRRNPPPQLNETEITAHYAKALALRDLIENDLQGKLGNMSIEALKQMPFSRFTALVRQMESDFPSADRRAGRGR